MSIAGAIAQVASTGMNMVNSNQDRQFNKGQAREADARALANSKEMAMFNNKIANEWWKKTNTAGQVKQLQEAGLNVGLMYGGSGAGGTATGMGQSASMQGTASKHQTPEVDGAGLAMQIQQAELMKAQKENIEADTDTKRAELPVKGETARQIQKETDYREYAGKDGKSGYDRKAEQERATIINTNQSTEKLIKDVENKEEELLIGWKNAKTTAERVEAQNKIEKFKAELEAMYPSQDKVTGRMINEMLEDLNRLTRQKETREERRRRIYGN